MKLIPFLVSLLLCASNASAATDLMLTVFVEGAEPNTGQIIATLFDSEQSYMKEPTAERTKAVDPNGQATIAFEDLSSGEYAVSVVYDENSNGKLDTGFLGIPKEKIGFSNNAKPRLGPAPYEKASFILTPQTTTITILVNRAKRD